MAFSNPMEKAFGWGNGHFVEMLSGGPSGRAVSNGFRNRGWEGEDLDKSATEDHDFTSSFGFCAASHAIFRLAMGDPLWTGLVCTSSSWVNRCTSERGPSDNYPGNQSLKHVAIGNVDSLPEHVAAIAASSNRGDCHAGATYGIMHAVSAAVSQRMEVIEMELRCRVAWCLWC